MGDITIQSEAVSDSFGTRLISLFPSASSPSTVYRVDPTLGTCDCPAWKFQKRAMADRLPCKHLIALGFDKGVRLVAQPIVLASHPQIEQLIIASHGAMLQHPSHTVAKVAIVPPANLDDAF